MYILHYTTKKGQSQSHLLTPRQFTYHCCWPQLINPDDIEFRKCSGNGEMDNMPTDMPIHDMPINDDMPTTDMETTDMPTGGYWWS